MAQSFRLLEEVALSDAAFEASGDSPAELFEAAARAVIETMVDPGTVTGREVCLVERQAPDLPTLLFDWLSRIVFLKDARGLVFREAAVEVRPTQEPPGWALQGRLAGEPIDPARHDLRADVKAVTKHLFAVREEAGQAQQRWVATVVLDL